MPEPRPITFLSDYGDRDEFAGVCRAVIARIAPDARVIDLGHGVERQDVRGGATVLADAVAFAPPGVHLAVVDPGVGTERRAIAVATAEEDRFFVGPDNGLLWPALERFGGAAEAVEVSGSPVRLEPVSATFHGRDLFAPVTAHLALSMPLKELGEPIDPGSIERLEALAPEIEPGRRLDARIGRIDGFGNASLIATAADAEAAGLRLGARLRVSVPVRSGSDHAIYAATFGEVAEGELLVYSGSAGALTLAVNRGDAARRLELATGDAVRLEPA